MEHGGDTFPVQAQQFEYQINQDQLTASLRVPLVLIFKDCKADGLS